MEEKELKAEEFFAQHEGEETNFEKIPEGDTYITKDTLTISTKKQDFGNGPKTRYNLKFKNKKKEDKEYEVGVKVYRGIKNNFAKDGEYIRITRSGTNKEDTTYTVTSVQN